MRILITGAAGFIGSHLADYYVAKGHEVVGIDNFTTGRRENFPRAATLYDGDIRFEVPHDAWDLVFHCAASYHDRANWERDASTNVSGTINVVREAQKSDAKLVYFQTALCYGLSPDSPVRIDAPIAPAGSYAISKTAGEQYIMESGLVWASLRLANIYGPRNVSGPPAAIYKRLKDGKAPVVVQTRRDFVYIGDLLDAATRIAESGHGVYHVSKGQDESIMDIHDAVVAALGKDPLSYPAPEVRPKPPGDAATILLDPSRMYLEFPGWLPATPLKEGIQSAVAWYEEHGVQETYTHLASAR